MGTDEPAGRILDDALTVDPHPEGLADPLIIERRIGVVHPQVEDVGATARCQRQLGSFVIVLKSSGPGLSMPSTVPDWNSTRRWALSALQRKTRVAAIALLPQKSALRFEDHLVAPARFDEL